MWAFGVSSPPPAARRFGGLVSGGVLGHTLSFDMVKVLNEHIH
jgi:hypothetical protein